MKAEMERLEARKSELEQALSTAEAPPPLLHPKLAEVYRRRITSLAEALAREETRIEAAEIIRSLVSRSIHPVSTAAALRRLGASAYFEAANSTAANHPVG
jgi:hypothetical protein